MGPDSEEYVRLVSACTGRPISPTGTTIIRRVGRGLRSTRNTIFINFSNLAMTSIAGLHHGFHRNNIRCGIVGGALAHVTTSRLNCGTLSTVLRNPATLTFSTRSTMTPTGVLGRFVGRAGARTLAMGTNLISNRIVSITTISTLTDLPDHRRLLTGLINDVRTPVSNLIGMLRNGVHGVICILSTMHTGGTRRRATWLTCVAGGLGSGVSAVRMFRGSWEEGRKDR